MRRGAWTGSAFLLAAVLLFCRFTTLGRGLPAFARQSLMVWSVWRPMPPEERRLRTLDETYPAVAYIRDALPPDAVVLLPPRKWIIEHSRKEVPLLAAASSVYNFIYPRVPVHWGDDSPWKDRVNYILVWNDWGLDLVDPGAPRTGEEVRLYPWPRGGAGLW